MAIALLKAHLTKRDAKVLLTALKKYEKSDNISETNRYTAQDLIKLITNQTKDILDSK